MSGLYLVIKRVHLSRSLSCLGNQGTAIRENEISAVTRYLDFINKAKIVCSDVNNLQTFILRDCAHVLRHSFKCVNKDIKVRAVNLTFHEEF